MLRRQSLGSVLTAVLFSTVVCAPAWPQDYPSRPIRMIVSSPAGSLVDVLSRLLTQDLGTRLGQSIVVDNRAGAMTQVAVDALARAARRLHADDRPVRTGDDAVPEEGLSL